MYRYITYLIKTIENVKLAKTNDQIDSQDSMDYIKGSSIRGAYIYEYIRKKGITNINVEPHKEKLLRGGINFLNAYPIEEKYDKRSIPFPGIYFAKKNDLRSFEKSVEMVSGLDNKLDPGYEKVRLADFATYDGKEYKSISVNKKVNLHINKSGDKNNLFRYESIESGQLFKGIIIVEDKSYIDEVIELFNNTLIYLGGSKGSGYGLCEISDMKVVLENPEYSMFNVTDDYLNYFYIYAMSDIIFRNEDGEYKTIIDDEYIKKQLKLDKVLYIDSVIETIPISSFNNKWNCHTPQIIAIKSGSIFKYKFEGDLNEATIKEFMDKGIGERRIDGYGRFVLLNNIDKVSNLYIRGKDFDDNKVYNDEKIYDYLSELLKDLDSQQKNDLQVIFTNMTKNRIESKIAGLVLDIDKNLLKHKDLNNSQWGNLKVLFEDMAFKKPDEGIRYFNSFIENIEKKRSTSFKQLNKIYYGKMTFIDYLKEYIKNIQSEENFFDRFKINRVELSSIKSKVDNDYIYKINLEVLIELCQLEIRRGKQYA